MRGIDGGREEILPGEWAVALERKEGMTEKKHYTVEIVGVSLEARAPASHTPHLIQLVVSIELADGMTVEIIRERYPKADAEISHHWNARSLR